MKEYEFDLPDGTKAYEFAASTREVFQLAKMHNAKGFRPVRK